MKISKKTKSLSKRMNFGGFSIEYTSRSLNGWLSFGPLIKQNTCYEYNQFEFGGLNIFQSDTNI